MITSSLIFGKSASGKTVSIEGRMANRHGLIAGATGTGKTVTLRVLAESFSRLGVPVFMADVKGDLSGIARPGEANPRIEERIQQLGITTHRPSGFPVVFWDLFGKSGHSIRTTVTEMGPLLIGRLLELSEAQSDALQLIFKIADDQQLLLIDLKDLQSVCLYLHEHQKEFSESLGGVSPSTLQTLQRKIVVLSEQGGKGFFGEPALEIRSLLRQDMNGQGLIHILDARELIAQPRLYSTFMLWLLSELFEDLEEVGDLEVPKMVFFFDEAHLLFQEAPVALVRQVEQVVRLIRSKGVGIYFVTQNPIDLPDTVLGQLGNRIQHALRAYTPKDQKAVKAAAETFPINPALETLNVITALQVGEALSSVLDLNGAPTPVERLWIVPPESRLRPLELEERKNQILRSPYGTQYDQEIDRESAYERLKGRRLEESKTPSEEEKKKKPASDGSAWESFQEKPVAKRPAGREPDSLAESLGKSAVRSVGSAIGSAVGRQIVRGILGSILGGKGRF